MFTALYQHSGSKGGDASGPKWIRTPNAVLLTPIPGLAGWILEARVPANVTSADCASDGTVIPDQGR